MSTMEFHPVQTYQLAERPYLPSSVTLRAYEVYCHIWGAQPAMVDPAGRGCRGGFSTGEIISFLYAHTFPKDEWETRVREANQVKP